MLEIPKSGAIVPLPLSCRGMFCRKRHLFVRSTSIGAGVSRGSQGKLGTLELWRLELVRRNTPLHYVSRPDEFGRSRSNRVGVSRVPEFWERRSSIHLGCGGVAPPPRVSAGWIWSLAVKRYELTSTSCSTFQGHSRSSIVARVDRLPMTSYLWFVATMGLYRTVSDINGHFCQITHFFLNHRNLMFPLMVLALEFYYGIWAPKN